MNFHPWHRAYHAIKRTVTRDRVWGAMVMVAAAIIFTGSGFWWGFHLGTERPKTVVVKDIVNREPGGGTRADFSTFWQAWQIIDDSYLKNGEVKNTEKVYGAIRGLVTALGDPHSDFLDPTETKRFEDDIGGNFGGIGIEIGLRNNQLVIVAPLKGTPGEQAGLLAGDKIVSINASSTEGFSVEKAVSVMRGEEGTKVTLGILRDIWKAPKDFPIIRARINVPTVDFEMKAGGVAYIQLHTFNAQANRLFYQALRKATAQNARGVVLDLRNNPGGYLQVAVDLAGWFVEPGKLVVSEAGRRGVTEVYRAGGTGSLTKTPVVALINGGSASAAEILAGALHANRGVKLVGEKSFGKGTVQELKDLADGSTLKVTVAHWVLPDGKILDGVGLTPDIEVKITEEDINKKRDPQLNKALEIVRAEIANTPTER